MNSFESGPGKRKETKIAILHEAHYISHVVTPPQPRKAHFTCIVAGFG